jgi:uncharacterized membrane protein
MKSSNLFQSRIAQTLAAALILASAGITSAYASEANAAPSKEMCMEKAKAQGLTGEKEKAFVDQCMHGG